MQLQFQGTPNSAVRIEWNTEARSAGWRTLLNGVTDNAGQFRHTDAGAVAAPRRVYRAVRD